MGGRNVDCSILKDILAGSEKPRHLPLEILTSITDNFSEDREIDRGGFGVVYKVKTVFLQRISNDAEHVNISLCFLFMSNILGVVYA